ncbi:hypothetical protein E2562_036493 [Oryza meyeriana var. granulata]|uniref:Uncharacterized protein n=1 Tax=Oryza meyeriana var. granulata TaxID=110450 RepID=A0A6G1CB59_9ORYZ|nr:hypothetical protein E2562_036493 [Oryza meyeriana var. granulata]
MWARSEERSPVGSGGKETAAENLLDAAKLERAMAQLGAAKHGGEQRPKVKDGGSARILRGERARGLGELGKARQKGEENTGELFISSARRNRHWAGRIWRESGSWPPRASRGHGAQSRV